MSEKIRSTTIIAVRKNNYIAMAGDGQVSLGNTIMKHTATKIRTLANGKVIVGFAGSTADALALFEKLDEKLPKYNNDLLRAAVELSKDWRTDKILRKLEAMLICADKEHTLLLSGSGDIMTPDDNIIAVGSGAPYATASAKALYKHSNLSAEEIARQSLEIAAEICIYTNNHITIHTLNFD